MNTPKATGVTRFKPGKPGLALKMGGGLTADTAPRKCAMTVQDSPDGHYSPKSVSIDKGSLGMKHSNDK